MEATGGRCSPATASVLLAPWPGPRRGGGAEAHVRGEPPMGPIPFQPDPPIRKASTGHQEMGSKRLESWLMQA